MELFLNFFLAGLGIVYSVFVYEFVSFVAKKVRRKIVFRKFVGTVKKINEFLEENSNENLGG